MIKDIVRMESFVADGVAERGRVIVLTNDPAYWQPGGGAETIDAQLRLHEGRVLEGALGWSARAGRGTVRGREEVLGLTGRYECTWRGYSTAPDNAGRAHHWRYLDVGVGGCRT